VNPELAFDLKTASVAGGRIELHVYCIAANVGVGVGVGVEPCLDDALVGVDDGVPEGDAEHPARASVVQAASAAIANATKNDLRAKPPAIMRPRIDQTFCVQAM
jgi:hypothetical protein